VAKERGGEGGEGEKATTTEEPQLTLAGAPTASKTQTRPLPIATRTIIILTKISLASPPDCCANRPSPPAAHVHPPDRPCSPGFCSPLWPPSRPATLPPATVPATVQATAINLAQSDAYAALQARDSGLEQGHQHHQFSDVQPNRWPYQPSPAWWSRYGLLAG